MTKITAQVTLDRFGLRPEDFVVNTYHFEDDAGFASDGGISVNGPGLVNRLSTFYNAISSTLSSRLTGTGTVRLYNMSDAKIRAPRLEAPITFTTGTAALPSEVAMVLSFQGTKESGSPQARRRGRVYIGPLTTAWAATGTAGDPDVRPSAVQRDLLLNSARTMARGGSGAYRLCVFSPTEAAGDDTKDSAWTDVEDFWVDDAFDTQRRRGAARKNRYRTSFADPTIKVTS